MALLGILSVCGLTHIHLETHIRVGTMETMTLSLEMHFEEMMSFFKGYNFGLQMEMG